MKCKNCGGDNNKFTEKCNYCGSYDWWPEYEFKPRIDDVETRLKKITIDPYKEAQYRAAMINASVINVNISGNYSDARSKLSKLLSRIK